MNNKTKETLIRVGTAVAVSAAAYFLFSDKTQNKGKAMMNRHKAKTFVKDKLKGNKKAMAVVDQLSDEEISRLLATVERVGGSDGKLTEQKDKLKGATADAKETLMDKTETVKDKFSH